MPTIMTLWAGGTRRVGIRFDRRKNAKRTRCLLQVLVMAVAIGGFSASSAPAFSLITDADIYAVTGNETQSGNGTLDLILFTESAGGSLNHYDGFDADDANTAMPGGGVTTADESYITSIGELRDFYDFTFGPGIIQEVVLFVDLNQTTGSPPLALETLDILIDYGAFGDSRDSPWTTDITSTTQNSTGSGYTGGTMLASLDSTKNLALNEQGAGWGDYMICTGINPYDAGFSNDTRILFNWASSNHDDGGETIFLSGIVPEPSTAMLLAVAGACMCFRRRVRRHV